MWSIQSIDHILCRCAIFDIGLCLRSSSSSSLTVVALQNFSLSHFRHRTLSEVVIEFIAYSCRFAKLFAQPFSTSDFVWGRRRVHRLQLSLCKTFRSAIFDIGLCLRSSSSSSLTVVAFQNFSLSHLRHRTLSGVVGVFIAGVVILNFSLNNHYRHYRRRTLPDVVNVFMNGNIILKFLSM